MSYPYEDLSTSGTFAKWENPGDVVEGVIVASSLDGGTDFEGHPVPQITVVTEGGNVIINGSQASLRRAFTNGFDRLQRGHRCRVEFVEFYETDKGSKGKSFRVLATPKPVEPEMTDVAANDPADEPF